MAGSYSATLVTLSVVVAMMAAYSALEFAGRVSFSTGRAARLWLIGGGFAMGAGIWSMHFIGMLAFSLPIPVAYDFWLTLASMIVAMLSSALALRLASAAQLRLWSLLPGGVAMGLGIVAMHYTGMAAMRMSPPIQYDPWLVAASVVIAVAASLAAMWLAFNLRAATSARDQVFKILAAIVMGLAISGMHYTAMAAANFLPGSVCRAAGTLALGGDVLAIAVATVVFSILTVALTASMFDARLVRQRNELLESLREKNEALLAEIARREDAQRQLEQKAQALEATNLELEQFAAVASHDLQAPLRSLAGFVQLLARRMGPAMDAKSTEYVQFVVDAANHMQRLIDALLALARVGRKALRPEPIELSQAVDEVRRLLADVIEQRNARIVAAGLPVVVADRVLLHQVLLNLINNALKFQPRNPPQVAVRAEERPDHWLITVTDRGIGIEPQHFGRIFQIFQRLHSTDSYEGTGIGLAICEKIVRRHGGRIWLESTPGEGSTFLFTLPRPVAIAAADSAPAASGSVRAVNRRA